MISHARISFALLVALTVGIATGLAVLLWPSRDDMLLMEYRSGSVSQVERVLQRNPVPSTEKSFLLSHLAEGHGKVEQAAQIVQEYLARHPQDRKARLEYWRLLKSSQQYETYLAELEQHYRPSDPVRYRKDALLLFDTLKQPQREAAFLQGLFEQRKLTPAEFQRLFWLRLKQQDFAAVDALLKKAPPYDKWQPELVRWTAEYLVHRQRSSEAVKLTGDFVKATRDKGLKAGFRQEMSFLFANLGEHRAAADVLRGGRRSAAVDSDTLLAILNNLEKTTYKDTLAVHELARRYRAGDLSLPQQKHFLEVSTGDTAFVAILAEKQLLGKLPADDWLRYFFTVLSASVKVQQEVIGHLGKNPDQTLQALGRMLAVPEEVAIPDTLATPEAVIVASEILAEVRRQPEMTTLLEKLPENRWPSTPFSVQRLGNLFLRTGLLDRAGALMARAPQAFTASEKAWLAAVEAYRQQTAMPSLPEEGNFSMDTIPYWQAMLEIARKKEDKPFFTLLYDRITASPLKDDKRILGLYLESATMAGKAQEVLPVLEKTVLATHDPAYASTYAEALKQAQQYEKLAPFSRTMRDKTKAGEQRGYWNTLYWQSLHVLKQEESLLADWQREAASLATPQDRLEQAYLINTLGYPEKAAALLMTMPGTSLAPDSKPVLFLMSLPLKGQEAARKAWTQQAAAQADNSLKPAWIRQMAVSGMHAEAVQLAADAGVTSIPELALPLAESLYQQKDMTGLGGLLETHADSALPLKEYRQLARYSVWANLPELSDRYYSRLLQEDSSYLPAHLILANNAANRQDYGKVLELLQPLAIQGDLPVSSQAQYAEALKRSGQEAEARAVYFQVAERLAEKPLPSPADTRLLASAQQAAGLAKEAIDTHYALLKQTPDDLDIRADLINLLIDNGRMQEAAVLEQEKQQ